LQFATQGNIMSRKGSKAKKNQNEHPTGTPFTAEFDGPYPTAVLKKCLTELRNSIQEGKEMKVIKEN
jgi:hypothetical protein